MRRGLNCDAPLYLVLCSSFCRVRVHCFFYHVRSTSVVIQNPDVDVLISVLNDLSITTSAGVSLFDKVIVESNERQFVSIDLAFSTYLTLHVKRVDINKVMDALTMAWKTTGSLILCSETL